MRASPSFHCHTWRKRHRQFRRKNVTPYLIRGRNPGINSPSFRRASKESLPAFPFQNANGAKNTPARQAPPLRSCRLGSSQLSRILLQIPNCHSRTLSPSFRRKPESSGPGSYLVNDTGAHSLQKSSDGPDPRRGRGRASVPLRPCSAGSPQRRKHPPTGHRPNRLPRWQWPQRWSPA